MFNRKIYLRDRLADKMQANVGKIRNVRRMVDGISYQSHEQGKWCNKHIDFDEVLRIAKELWYEPTH